MLINWMNKFQVGRKEKKKLESQENLNAHFVPTRQNSN